MKNVNQVLDNEQVKFYKDAQGRAWRSCKTGPGKNCYSLQCKARAVYELVRSAQTLVRRELLCARCLRVRQLGLKLVEIVHSEKE